MARRFVLVEILESDTRYLLTELRQIFQARTTRTPVHVTIRGPYPKSVSKGLIENLEERLKKDVLLIAGVGLFRSPGRSVVFLRVSSKRLRGVWWKPDFPAKVHGFQPHITLYEGSDHARADAIVEFLKAERIELVCHEFQVVPHASGQFPSFYDTETSSKGSIARLVSAGRVKHGILGRARRLLREDLDQLPLFVDVVDGGEREERSRDREPLVAGAWFGKSGS